ncbi:MAG TPA: putative Ig domain-containing protein, partial [Myxococcales bacterium]|nr:putative Ig domain-containing protein [Myxococcales bacterium]
MTFDASGQLRGPPDVDGDFSIQVTATDSKGQTADRSYPLKIFPALTFTTTSLSPATSTQAYSAAVAVSGGKPPVTVVLSSGTLPSGLTFSNGTISGTPASPGSASLTFTATDANGATATATLPLTVRSPFFVSTTSLPTGYMGRSYTTSLTASGGTAPLTWSYETGTAPAGTTLMSNGTIAGTPEAVGTTNFTVKVTDGDGRIATAPLSLEVIAPPVIGAFPCPDGYGTRAYSTQWTASGGQAPLSWAVSSGVLPGGLSIDTATGAVTGTPSAAGQSTASITVTDANGVSDTRACSISVYDLPAITSSPCPDGYVTEAYSAQWAASGGKAPLAWTVAAGALPGGLSLGSTTGAITGAPTAASQGNLALAVTDANGVSDSLACPIAIYALPAITTGAVLPDLTAGTSATGTFAATGG